jgi:hypothetical protein
LVIITPWYDFVTSSESPVQFQFKRATVGAGCSDVIVYQDYCYQKLDSVFGIVPGGSLPNP